MKQWRRSEPYGLKGENKAEGGLDFTHPFRYQASRGSDPAGAGIGKTRRIERSDLEAEEHRVRRQTAFP